MNERTTTSKRILELEKELAFERAKSVLLLELNRNYQHLLTRSPITIWEQDITKVKHHIDTLRHSGIYDFRAYFQRNRHLISDLIHELDIADLNRDEQSIGDVATKDTVLRNIGIPFSRAVYNLFREGLTAVAEGKERFQSEFTAMLHDGERKIFVVNWYITRTGNNGNYSAFISLTDITRSKLMEIKLRESEEKHRLLLKSIANPTIAIDREHKIVYYNEAFHRLCGSPMIKLEGRNLEDVFPSFLNTVSWSAMLEVMNDGRERTVKSTFFGKIWRSRIYPTPWGTISIINDITELETSKRILEESRQKYSSIVEHATDGIIVVQDEKIVFSNPKAKEIAELDNEDEVFFWEVIHPDDRALVIDRYNKRMDHLETPSEYCIRAISRKKRDFYAEIKSVAIEWQAKPAVLAIINNISPRIAIERALEESKEKYKAIMQQSGDNIYLAEYQTYRLLETNKALQELLGYSEEELKNMTVFDFIDHPRENILSKIDKVEFHGSLFLPNRRYIRQNGETIDVEVSASMITYQGKQALCVVSRDISARRKLEQEREKLIADLQSALANVKKLSGLLPICSSCKKIRDDEGYWQEVERFLVEHSEAEFTHGICPECAKKFYPSLYKKND